MSDLTDLKIDSQSTRTVHQPGQPSSSITAGASDSIEPAPEAAPKQKRRTVTKIDSAKPDATPAKPEKSSTGAKSKRQATSKAPNQSASTRVKLTWEPTPSIETVMVELNAFNERLNATKVALDELRATVEATVDKPPQNEARSTVQLPLEMPPKAQAVDRDALLSAIDETTAPQLNHRVPSPAPTQQPQPVDRISPPPQPIPTFRPTTRPTPQQQRRKSLNRLRHFVLHLPKKPLAIAIDAALWVLASAGLRIGLNTLAIGLPLLSGPIKALLIVPALIAIYSAFFVPQANQVGIYRLLLISLGLFIGGKLL